MGKLSLKLKVVIVISLGFIISIFFIGMIDNFAVKVILFVVLFGITNFLISDFLNHIEKLARQVPEEAKEVVEKIEVKEKDEAELLSDVFQKIIEDSRRKKKELDQIIKEQSGKVKEMDKELEKKVYDLFTLFEVAKELNSTLESGTILKTVVFTCMAHLGVTNTALLLIDNFIDINAPGSTIIPAIIHGLDPNVKRDVKFNINSDLVQYLKKKSHPITKNEIDQLILTEDETECLKKLNFSLCSPLLVKDDIKGLLFVGPKKISNAKFTQANLELLSTLIGLAALALENSRLYTLAITDGLTRVYTHRFFQLRLKEEVQRAIRYKHPLTLIMVDIDHFKEVNDTYGHQIGDEVLVKVASLCKGCLRGSDFIARYGGEEFVLILPEVDEQQAYVASERIRKKIEQHSFSYNNKKLSVTISLGIANCPKSATSEKELVENADKALYKAKNEGRNRSCLFNGYSKTVS